MNHGRHRHDKYVLGKMWLNDVLIWSTYSVHYTNCRYYDQMFVPSNAPQHTAGCKYVIRFHHNIIPARTGHIKRLARPETVVCHKMKRIEGRTNTKKKRRRKKRHINTNRKHLNGDRVKLDSVLGLRARALTQCASNKCGHNTYSVFT